MDHHEENIEGEKSYPCNYLFFSALFVFLAILHGLHVSLVEVSYSFSRHYFLFYAIGQSAFLTMSALALFTYLQKISPPIVIKASAALLSFFVVGDVIDFFMERLMGISIWYAMSFVAKEAKGNFVELLRASNISLGVWALAFFAAAFLMLAGMCFFHISEKLCLRYPKFFSRRYIISIGVASLVYLCLWDAIFSPFASEGLKRRYTKALPLKMTLFPAKEQQLLVSSFLKKPWKDNDCFAGLDSTVFSLQHKPDIFLFIAESLREDFMTQTIAPHISSFREQSIHFPRAFSSANATHVSWFSLFYSLFPLHFGNYQNNQWDKGSVPLSLLKKMGYEIHLYSGSRLKYYNMDEVLFGEGMHLLSSKRIYPQEMLVEPFEADRRAIEDLCHEVNRTEKVGGRVFITFLDSTHFGYSWPEHMPAAFDPYDDKINFIDAALFSKNLHKIKNRYSNSIRYIDSLFGQFTTFMKSCGRWEDATVVFTADHGEEFYENGHLFHASDLSTQQIHVPLYFKMGSGQVYEQVASHAVVSHMDIFPTLFHYLIGSNCLQDVLQGQSIFSKNKAPFAVCGRFNAGFSPAEFCIHNEQEKLLLAFEKKDNIFSCRSLSILGLKNMQDEDVPCSLPAIHEKFGQALDTLFSP